MPRPIATWTGLAALATALAPALAQDAGQRQVHWAFVRPERPQVPADGGGWARGPIDRFVLTRMRERGLAPSPEAGREELIRRVTLALTGLPPALADVDAFVGDAAPDAYERVVDRLLGSVAYAEHQTRRWLDLARYADTNGYEKDRPRRNWLWRDWVIDAFARDLPFDQFTIQQFAGDLLPGATLEQRIATGFHRNSMLNDEGGIDAEEFRVVAVKDRVDATARTFLGLTLDCAQCHDHKYDPIPTEEYYRFYAFFDQTEDVGVGEAPTVTVPAADHRAEHERLLGEIAGLEAELRRDDPALRAAFERWLAAARRDVAERRAHAPVLGTWHHVGPIPISDPERAYAREFPPERGVRLDRKVRGSSWTAHDAWPDGQVHALESVVGVNFLYRAIESGAQQQVTLLLGSDDGIEVRLNGVELFSKDAHRVAAPDQDRVPAVLLCGRNELLLKVVNKVGASGFCFELIQGDEPSELVPVLERTDADYTDAERARLDAHFREVAAPELETVRVALRTRRGELERIPTVTTMVLAERGALRETRLLERGDFRQPGARVAPGVPGVLHPFPDGAPRDRLGLARWLVHEDNPLLGRVVANRIWAEHFGRGLVRTPEDFGTRGAAPTHPQLLDWLARAFVDGGYSLKALHRQIVTSATFRQSAHASPAARAGDPDNTWLARGPRHRLTFEAIRDVSLAVAGLLHRQVGGPSVMPPQPPGIWENSFGFYDLPDRWTESEGAARHRRGIYVFLRRTAIYPTYQIFDGPSREVCAVARSRTNTPLQALATLNDPAFVEAAGGLARRVLRAGGDATTDDSERIAHAFRLCTARRPSATEARELDALLRDASAWFRADPAAARSLCAAARIEPDDLDPTPLARLAAWILAANVLLNLDETLTR